MWNSPLPKIFGKAAGASPRPTIMGYGLCPIPSLQATVQYKSETGEKKEQHMQTLFELKTKLPVDMDVFKQMEKIAEAELSKAEPGRYTQAVVLLSNTGNEYSTLIKNALSKEKADETAFLEEIKNVNDTEICYVLCMWQADKCIDIPSFDFRKLLCSLNPKNTEALLFVMTANGVSGIKVSTTMK